MKKKKRRWEFTVERFRGDWIFGIGRYGKSDIYKGVFVNIGPFMLALSKRRK